MNRHQRNRRREFAKAVNRKAMFCAVVRSFTVKIETPFLDTIRWTGDNIYRRVIVPAAFFSPKEESPVTVGLWPENLPWSEFKVIAEDPDLEDQYHG